MSFDALLDELESLRKGYGPGDDDRGDKKIRRMAADDHEEPDEDDEDDFDGLGDGDEDDMPVSRKGQMAKSFVFALDDGTEVEAQDGSALVKSLMDRMDTNDFQVEKGFAAVIDLVKSQAAAIGDLRAEIKRLGGEGRGRKSTVSIAERLSPLAKSEPPAAGDVLAKAMSAFDAGKINGRELSVIDVSLRTGNPVDAPLLAKIEPPTH